MQAVLLWYESFPTYSRANRFKLNHYAPFIADKTINGKQCTIFWHVDDSKISHEDPKVVSEVIMAIHTRVRDKNVHRGKKHTFLGIDMKLKSDKTVELGMEDYIIESINAFAEKMVRCSQIPAT